MIDIDNYVHIRQATKQGFIKCKVGGVADLSYPTSKLRRGRVINEGEVSPTLMSGESGICRIEKGAETNNVIHHRYRIRKLTALECFRLMSFDDEDYFAAAEENSETQLYKEAGNSIVVSVLVAIFSQMGIGKKWNDLSDENKERLSENRMREETSKQI